MTAATLAQLKKEFSQLSAQANRRIDSLKKGRYRSPAVEKLREQGVRRFGVKAQKLKTEADYRKAIKQAKNFLSSETSTRKGLKKVTKEMMRNFGIKKRPGQSLSEITRKSRKLFSLYDDLKELYNQGKFDSNDKYELMEMMSQMYDLGMIDQSTAATQIVSRLNAMITQKKAASRTRQAGLNFSWEV